MTSDTLHDKGWQMGSRSKEEIQQMISDVDDDASGTIEYEEFEVLKMTTHRIPGNDDASNSWKR